MILWAPSSPHDGGMSLAQEDAYWGPPCWSCDGGAYGDLDDLCPACLAEREQADREAEGRCCRAWRERQGVTLEQIDAYGEATNDTRCHTAAEIADMEAGTHEGDPDTWLPAITDTVARVLAARRVP